MGSNKIKGKCNHTHNGWELQRPPRLFFGKIRVTLHPARTRTRTILRIFMPHSISLVWLLARFPDFIFDNLLYIFKASAALGGKGSDRWLNTKAYPLSSLDPCNPQYLRCFSMFPYTLQILKWHPQGSIYKLSHLSWHFHYSQTSLTPTHLPHPSEDGWIWIRSAYPWIWILLDPFYYNVVFLQFIVSWNNGCSVSSLTSFDCELVRFISFLLIFTDV